MSDGESGDAGDMHDAPAAAAPAAASSAARKRKSAAEDQQPQSERPGRPGRHRAAVNYNEDAGAEGDERKERDDDDASAAADDDGGDDGSEASAPAARPAKKRRSGPAAGSKKKRGTAAPTSAASAEPDDDAYDHAAEGEDERKAPGAARKKRTSKSGAAAAARRGREAAAALDREAVASDDESLQIERRLGNGAAAASSSGAVMSSTEMANFISGDVPSRRGARRAVDPSSVAESGILLSLLLRNFMNHKNFEIEFNPNVNFIHGKNGSGKSSILHAIQVVFGSAARETSRGSAMKALIHYGKEEAEITVVVKNEGDSAFKHDQYGDAIRIVRKIKRTGGGGYQFLNDATESVVSRETRELRDLNEHFNIQVSNPSVIMTQEVSKKFLQSQRAEDKYTFFLKATQLEWLRQNLAESRDKIAEMHATIEIEQKKIPDLDARIKHLKQQEALAQEAESLELEIRHLVAAAAWKQVQDMRIEFDRREFEMNELAASVRKAAEKRAILEADFGGDVALKEFQQTHDELIKAASARASESARLQVIKESEIKKIQHDQRQLLSRIQLLENKIVACRKNKEKNDREIAKIAAANSKDNSEANAARTAKMEALLEKRKQTEEQIAAKRAEIASQHALEVAAGRAESTAVADFNTARARLSKAQADLRGVQEGAGGAAAAGGSKYNPMFGFRTAEFWREIKKEHWTHEPIGPLGEHVQVPDEHERWLQAINQCMRKKEMSAYVVDNFADQQKLQKIFTRVMAAANDSRFKPIIQVIPFGPKYKVVPPKVPFPLVYDCIRIDNPIAFNAVLFACKPERFGLHTDIVAAEREIGQYRNRGQGSPDYVNGTFLLTGAKISIRGDSASGSTIREAPLEPRLFRISHAERISELTQVVNECKAQCDEAQRECEKAKHEIASFAPTKHALKHAVLQLSKAHRDYDEQLGDLEAETEREKFNRSRLDDTPLVEANADLLNEIGEHEANIETIKAQDSSHFADRIHALEAEKSKLALAERDAQAEVQIEDDLVSEFLVKWCKKDHKIKKLRVEEKTQEDKRVAVELVLARVSATLNQAEHEASLLSDEVESPDSEKVLVAKITAKQNTLAEKKKRNAIDIIKVRDELKAVQSLREKIEASMAGVTATHDALAEASRTRIKKLAAFRHTLAEAASIRFNDLLSKSGAAGRLEFNPKEQTLNLIVNTDVRDVERAEAANTVALSGGERSTTTISFVLAVGEHVECPFRAIDEFDVFMDSINRRTAMNLLLADASSKRGRQFFFLTPQDISVLPRDDPYLKLHVLADPPRDHNERRIDSMINGHDDDDDE